MTAEQEKEIFKIVTGFRKGMLGKKNDPLKMCWKICLPLSSYLGLCGYKNEVTEGKVRLNGHNKGLTINHFWLTLSDKRIIDPTASQFNGMGNEDMPHVYLGMKPKWYSKHRTQKIL